MRILRKRRAVRAASPQQFLQTEQLHASSQLAQSHVRGGASGKSPTHPRLSCGIKNQFLSSRKTIEKNISRIPL
jgi:hypothetical protein